MGFSIKTFSYGSPEYHLSIKLRYRILRLPLGLEFTEDELKKDVGDTHFGLFENERLLACLILSTGENGRLKMRQVAVDDACQGKGLGKMLSLAAEAFAKKHNFGVIYCNARKSAAPFYQKLGYKITSAEFTEVGIPHYVMEKELE